MLQKNNNASVMLCKHYIVNAGIVCMLSFRHPTRFKYANIF